MEPRTDPNPVVISPDGRWLAYSGRPNIFVRARSGSGATWQATSAGGRPIAWLRDGHELVSRQADGAVMSVPYTVDGTTFVPGKPRSWSDKPLGTNIDLSPDGKVLIGQMRTPGSGDDERPQHVAVLLNFADELRRKVPSKK